MTLNDGPWGAGPRALSLIWPASGLTGRRGVSCGLRSSDALPGNRGFFGASPSHRRFTPTQRWESRMGRSFDGVAHAAT